MNITEHLLTCVAEECAEVQQAICKALRFGLDDGYPNSGTTNAQDIERELIDLAAVLDLCRDRGILGSPDEVQEAYRAKQAKVKKFMEYAKERGTLEG